MYGISGPGMYLGRYHCGQCTTRGCVLNGVSEYGSVVVCVVSVDWCTQAHKHVCLDKHLSLSLVCSVTSTPDHSSSEPHGNCNCMEDSKR